jgi:SAM-dependent methyltransferase
VTVAGERLDSEREFHNRAFRDQPRQRVSRYYAIKGAIDRAFDALLFAAPAGQHVLEYGCGMGERLFRLSRAGASCHGIDLSDYAIDSLRQRAAAAGLDIDYQVMNAESMTYEDRTFDLVFGSGILHHLDLETGLGSVARTLKPGGRAVFIEPLGHNPLVNGFRRSTPGLRTPDEHPLRRADLAVFRRHFGRVRLRPYFLFSLVLPVLLGRHVPRPLLALGNGFDRVVFALLPPLRWQAWQVLLVLEQPQC